MKLLAFIIAMLFYQDTFCQDSTFSITENKDVTWKNVFETNHSFAEIFFSLKKSGLFNNLDSSANTIIGEIKKGPLDYSNAKETIWKSEIPLYIKTCDFTASFEINYKPQKYRVIVKNINCIGKAENLKDNMFVIKPDEEHPISFFALKNKTAEFTKPFIKYSMPIFTNTFIKKFVITDAKTSDW